MFRCHNSILKNRMEQMLDTFKDICDGRDISIGSLVRDKDGHYSDGKMTKLIDQLVMADYSEADMYMYSSTERCKREEDYLSTLLYVVIRAAQAGISRVREGGLVKAVKDDSFASIIMQFNASKDVYLPTVVSGSMKATIETVYMLLSGKRLVFPDPFRPNTLKEEIEKHREEAEKKASQTEAETELDDEDEEEMPEDIDDDGLFGWDDDMFTEEEMEAVHQASVVAAIRDEEEEDFYKGDPQSREDYYKDHKHEDEWWIEEREWFSKYSLGDPDDEEYKERYEKEKKRLMIFFAAKQEFINKYEHLYEITTVEDKDFVKNVEAKINAWLKNNDKTIYMNDDDFMAVYESLYEAVSEARLRQGKNK